jgi:hypothetical protein
MPDMALYAKPVYEAVVCGLALQGIEQEEAAREHEETIKSFWDLLAKSKEVIDLFARADVSQLPKPRIVFIAMGLRALMQITPALISSAEKLASSVEGEYAPVYKSIVRKLFESTEKIEEVAEAWSMALDERLTNEIKEALKEIDSRKNPEDIPDWRDTLGPIQD